MDRIDRIQQLNRIFKASRKPVSFRKLSEELDGCSRSTIERDIEYLRNSLNAPLTKNKEGWLYDRQQRSSFELPGIWLTPDELQSLVLIINLLGKLSGGFIADELKLVRDEIDKLLKERGIQPEQVSQFFKVLPIGARQIPTNIFSAFGSALINKKCMYIQYIDYQGKRSSRTVSPQNLVYYRDNWYIDAWCHKRKGLRTFSLARINDWQFTATKPVLVDEGEIASHFEHGYGLFSGEATKTAVLLFLPPIANDVATQQWHPQQTAHWVENCYQLSFPYSDDRELIRDILRHLPNVQVLSPPELKSKVKERLTAALQTLA